MPRRVAQCAASLPTRPARLRAQRPLSCDTDLDGRRDEQNGPAHSRADTERRSRTRSAKPRTRRRRGVRRVNGVEPPVVRFKMSRVDGVLVG